MNIKRSGSQPSGKGQAEYFTGNVRIDPLSQAPTPARVSVASVTFEPGARTAWHRAGVNRSRRFSRVTCSGPRRVRSIGTAPQPPRP